LAALTDGGLLELSTLDGSGIDIVGTSSTGGKDALSTPKERLLGNGAVGGCR